MIHKIYNYLQHINYEDDKKDVKNLHIAFLCSNNKIYFIGYNSSRSIVSSINYQYHSLHAEIDAIRHYKTSNSKKRMNILCGSN